MMFWQLLLFELPYTCSWAENMVNCNSKQHFAVSNYNLPCFQQQSDIQLYDQIFRCLLIRQYVRGYIVFVTLSVRSFVYHAIWQLL